MFYKIMFCIILFIVAKFSGIVVVEFLTHMSKVIERKIKNDVDKQIKIEYNNEYKEETNMEYKKFTPLNVSSKFAICGLPLRVDTYKTCSFNCKY